MTREEFMKLINAGYTKTEINALMGIQAPTQPTQPTQDPQAQAPQAPQAPTPQQIYPYLYGMYPAPMMQPQVQTPAVQAPEDTGSKTFDDLYKEMQGVKDMLASNAIIASQQPEQKPDTYEQVLASILDPMGNMINDSNNK